MDERTPPRREQTTNHPSLSGRLSAERAEALRLDLAPTPDPGLLRAEAEALELGDANLHALALAAGISVEEAQRSMQHITNVMLGAWERIQKPLQHVAKTLAELWKEAEDAKVAKGRCGPPPPPLPVPPLRSQVPRSTHRLPGRGPRGSL